MSTQGIALLLIAVMLAIVVLIHFLAFVYDWLIPDKWKQGRLKKFDDWWESLAWNSGQW